MNDTTKGIGRIAKTYFSSKDQLVTLGFARRSVDLRSPARRLHGMATGRAFGALINNHNVGNPSVVISAAADARNGTDWSDVTFVHCTRWQDEAACPGQFRIAWLSEGQPIESVGDLARPWRARLDRRPHRDADEARDAAVSGGARSRHPAQPQPRRRHEHDHRSVLADARCVLSAARAGQRSRLSREQPRRSAGASAGHLSSGDRDGDHRGRGAEPRPRQGRHAHARQGSRHRRARCTKHQHLADEQRARHDRDDDESQARPRRDDCGEGRVLEGQARRVERRRV